MHLVGKVSWLCSLGRVDLQFARSVLSRYLSKPRALHWDLLVYVVGYLRAFPHLGLVMDGRDMIGLPEVPAAHSEADVAKRNGRALHE